ncbi:hypothetical protein GPJ56_000529 [Histomonas meleagridis]|uniref:uncharacterized protein n=1 Tax=Histomonas meleagridis TaxID=135588 RepID=UPI0035599220|nr:hypothetical protein GPJ56_000529 [Histomonas meleagridis]KAH0796431.1 hypothetical protein GO595_010324 [Histomonas meleagridis]
MLQLQLMIPRNRTISSLHREGWKDAQEKYQNLVVPLVGENTAKDWLILVYPEDTEIAMYISQTPRLIATEANIRRSDINIQEAPKQQQNQNKESLFPLVSIQYERELFNTEVVDFIPLEEAVKTTKPKMEIVMCQSYDFRTAK